MDKIRRILFSILQKIAGGKIFRRVIHVGLITVIFILAGRSSKPVPTPTITITNAPVATATSTITPTPTIVPKPNYITDDNSVQADSGTVFVKNGKAMIYDTKTGEIKKIDDLSTDVTFNTTEDASKIVLALHAPEFADQEQMHTDLTPGITESAFSYNMELNQASGSGTMTNGIIITIPGLPSEFVKVKSPTKTIAFPKVGVVMLKQYGNLRPVPVILGVFDKSDDNVLHPFYSHLGTTPAASYPNKFSESLVENNQSWESIVATLKDRIIRVSPLLSRDPRNTDPYVSGFVADGLPDSAMAERDRLIQLEVRQAEVADAIYRQPHFSQENGVLVATLEKLMMAAGKPDYFFISESDYLYTITQ